MRYTASTVISETNQTKLSGFAEGLVLHQSASHTVKQDDQRRDASDAAAHCWWLNPLQRLKGYYQQYKHVKVHAAIQIQQHGANCLYNDSLVARAKLWQRNAAIFVLLFVPVLLSSGADNGLQILKRAESTLQSLAFAAKCDFASGITCIVTQKKVDKQGYLIKKEYIFEAVGVLQTNIYLLNDNGYWRILPGEALRLDYRKPDYKKLQNGSAFFGLCAYTLDLSIPASYQVEQKVVKGREVYVICQTVQSPSGSYIAPGDSMRCIVTIGKSDNLIYGITSQSGGKVLSQMTVASFQILSNLDDNVFQLPGNIKETVCTNVLQYANVTMKSMDDLMQSPRFKLASANNVRNYRLVRCFLVLSLLTPAFAIGFYYSRAKPK